MMRVDSFLQSGVTELQTSLRALESDDGLRVKIESLASHVLTSLSSGGKLLFFGNGGSAAEAQHMAAEYVNYFSTPRKPLAAISLNSDVSNLTAISNDASFTDVFSRQVQALGLPGDVAVGFSTSGRSENVLRGLESARARGLFSVLFTGRVSKSLSEVADLVIDVPATSTPRIQELHTLIGHCLVEYIEQTIVRGIE